MDKKLIVSIVFGIFVLSTNSTISFAQANLDTAKIEQLTATLITGLT